MMKSVKRYVVSAFHAGKSREHVRDELFRRVSDVETNKALRYFDKLCLHGNKKTFCLKNIPKVIFYFFKVSFLFFVFFSLKISLGIKRLFFGREEEITFEEIKKSFSFAKISRKIRYWFEQKSKWQKRMVFFVGIILVLMVSLVIYASFFHYKDCENASCFREMVSKCHRTRFVSREFISLDNQIRGLTLKGCKIEVKALDNDLGISSGKKMTCFFPYGLKLLPQTKIEFCSGELREEIQTLIISELYKTVGQNIEELNTFFKKR